MGKVIRGMFDADEEMTERDRARLTYVRTLVLFLAAAFASAWFLRGHHRVETATGTEWSLQLVAGMLSVLVTAFLFLYLWKQLEDNHDKDNPLGW